MPAKQSWDMCKYAVAAGAGEMGYELREHGLSESYACENADIVASGRFPAERIREEDGSYTTTARLHGILIPGLLSEQDAQRLEVRVEEALAVCWRCRFYESK